MKNIVGDDDDDDDDDSARAPSPIPRPQQRAFHDSEDIFTLFPPCSTAFGRDAVDVKEPESQMEQVLLEVKEAEAAVQDSDLDLDDVRIPVREPSPFLPCVRR